jgi:hypothetical protein
MEPRKYFIPGLTFERLSSDDQALKSFQELLNSIKSANWNVFKAEETDDDGLAGMTLFMKPF